MNENNVRLSKCQSMMVVAYMMFVPLMIWGFFLFVFSAGGKPGIPSGAIHAKARSTVYNIYVADLHPRDSSGNELGYLTVDVMYTLSPKYGSTLSSTTGGLDQTPGQSILDQMIVPRAVETVTEKSSFSDISSRLNDYANSIKNATQDRLDAVYEGKSPIIIQAVTIVGISGP